jgi:hypothetical protein
MAFTTVVLREIVMSGNATFYIYGSMTERKNRTQCISMHDVMAKFKEVVRVYRQRGSVVSEASDKKWVIADPKGTTDAIWIEDSAGQIVKATDV